MSFLKCTDPNEEGNFLVMENGQIGIWKKVAGQSRLFVPLTQITSVKIEEGQTTTLPDRYETTPSVFLCPNNLCTYVGAANTVNQEVNITSPNITNLTNGEYSISGQKSEVKTSAGSVFLPIDIRYENTNFYAPVSLNQTWGPIYAPNVQSASIGAFITYRMLSGIEYSDIYYFYSYITFRVGVSVTSASAKQWGTVASVTNSNGANVHLIASVTATGNYIWLQATGQTLSTKYAVSPPQGRGTPFYYGHIFVQFIGGTVTTSNTAFHKDGSFDCVVCGR